MCINVTTKICKIEILSNDHGKSEAGPGIFEELIKVETDGIVLNESTSQLVTSEEIN